VRATAVIDNLAMFEPNSEWARRRGRNQCPGGRSDCRRHRHPAVYDL